MDNVDFDSDGSIRIQRHNVWLIRAKERMHFVLSKPLEQYRGAIGDALRYYKLVLDDATTEILPEEVLFVVNGKKVGLVHGWGGPWRMAPMVREVFSDVDLIIYGQSHEPYNQYIQGCLFFNPGRARDSFGLVTVADEITAEIIRI